MSKDKRGGKRGKSDEDKKKAITALNKSIKSLEKQIEKHESKIKDFIGSVDYKNMSEKKRAGLIGHWEKEIAVFKENIKKAKEERKKLRGR